jgi:hypothetical protein
VLREIEPVPKGERRPGLFMDAVRVLSERPSFAAAIEAADTRLARTTDGFDRFISRLCRCTAALYLANPQARIAYVHTVTAPSALRLIAAHLSESTRERLAGRAVQAAAALHVVSAADPDAPGSERDDEVLRAAEDTAEIRYHAACSLDEHAIKFTEACLREDARAPDPVFRLAAADAALRIGGPRTARC